MNKYFLILAFFFVFSCTTVAPKNVALNFPEISQRSVSSNVNKNLVDFFDISTIENESVKLKEYNLNTQMTEFKNSVEQYIGLYEVKIKAMKKNKQFDQNVKQQIEGKGFKSPSNGFDFSDTGVYLGVRKILALIDEADKNPERKDVKIFQIEQLTQAIYQKYTPPIKSDYEILALPITILRQLNYTTVNANNDLSTISTDPEIHKEFVTDEIEKEASNFFSYKFVNFDYENCGYLKSKKGYGVHSGFQIKCGEQSFKVKFGGEIYSGPFNTRIYSSLGYKVPTINYFEALKVKYDRRIIQEYNQRAAMPVNITFASKNVYEYVGFVRRDPFLDFAKFIMKDGSELTAAEAKSKLMLKYDKNLDPVTEDFSADFELQIDSIILTPVTLTLKENKNSVEVGPWRADDLNYSKFKEIRALMVLSAWIGNFDVRKDNLAVYLESSGSGANIKVGISDAGAGLGKATMGLSKISSSEVDKMVWEVSETYRDSKGDGEFSNRIQLIGLMNIEINRAFESINISDAQWMLSKMCRISKENLIEGLVASGMSSAEVVLAAEKLISRRNKMLVDFDVSADLKKQCFVNANKHINYDPTTNGLVQIKNSRGEIQTAPARNQRVLRGVLTTN